MMTMTTTRMAAKQTLSEQNLYRRLSEYYDLLEDLDNYVRGCAQNFNGSYLEEDRTTRQNLADVAKRTEDTIEQYYDIVEDLDVPTSSKNYSSGKTSLPCTTTWITALTQSVMPGRSA